MSWLFLVFLFYVSCARMHPTREYWRVQPRIPTSGFRRFGHHSYGALEEGKREHAVELVPLIPELLENRELTYTQQVSNAIEAVHTTLPRWIGRHHVDDVTRMILYAFIGIHVIHTRYPGDIEANVRMANTALVLRERHPEQFRSANLLFQRMGGRSIDDTIREIAPHSQFVISSPPSVLPPNLEGTEEKELLDAIERGDLQEIISNPVVLRYGSHRLFYFFSIGMLGLAMTVSTPYGSDALLITSVISALLVVNVTIHFLRSDSIATLAMRYNAVSLMLVTLTFALATRDDTLLRLKQKQDCIEMALESFRSELPFDWNSEETQILRDAFDDTFQVIQYHVQNAGLDPLVVILVLTRFAKRFAKQIRDTPRSNEYISQILLNELADPELPLDRSLPSTLGQHVIHTSKQYMRLIQSIVYEFIRLLDSLGFVNLRDATEPRLIDIRLPSRTTLFLAILFIKAIAEIMSNFNLST